MLDLSGINFLDYGPWGLLLLSWGFIVFCIIKGILVPKPHHDATLETLKTERASRQMLEDSVKAQNTALAAIAEGVETIKRATVPKRSWWDRREDG